MRIAIMGTGGVGGYFGGLLAQAGEDVIFIARGEHQRAIQSQGLRVKSVHGDFTIRDAQVSDDPATVGPVDLVLFATKTYHIDAAAAQISPLIGPSTVVLPLQNGVDASERMAAVIGEAFVLGGACWLVSTVEEPGLIRQRSQFRRIALGELAGPITPRVEAAAQVLRRAGITVEVSANINKIRWTKFLFIASYSGVGAVARAPAGELMACAETRVILEQAMIEAKALAEASGVQLDEDVVAQAMAFCDNLAPDATTSMQRDIMEGKPSELEAQNGYIALHGAELGVPVPAHTFLYSVLLPQEHRAREQHR
ncbi:MAG: 2-dehydropantoate 2-reductase [Anaerolineae bacterium]|nr:2-dehydropantoate 2-reductase [Anaerolineae bacterium]